MSETVYSQAQEAQAAWTKAIDGEVARVAGFCEEVAKLEAKRAEQLAGAVDEAARMTKESMAYVGRLSEEWRRLSLEATRRALSMMSFGGR